MSLRARSIRAREASPRSCSRSSSVPSWAETADRTRVSSRRELPAGEHQDRILGDRDAAAVVGGGWRAHPARGDDAPVGGGSGAHQQGGAGHGEGLANALHHVGQRVLAAQDRVGEQREGVGLRPCAGGLRGPACRVVDHDRDGDRDGHHQQQRGGVVQLADGQRVQRFDEQVVQGHPTDQCGHHGRGDAADEGDRHGEAQHRQGDQAEVVGVQQRQRQGGRSENREEPAADPAPAGQRRCTPGKPASRGP